MNAENVTYFNNFGVEYIPKEVRKFIGNKNYSKYRMQAYDSIMCGYFCNGFLNFMLKGESLLEFIITFSLRIWKEWQNNIKIFSIESRYVKIMKIYFYVCNKYRKSKKTKIYF